ncbi:OmpA family protein [Varunaivibrio sulfuroxidans]|nr:OmpA family protein [Varunaivibrio sulfuroxidans]WES31800.1 OmpA family protein [Varunaivibrio sulfuroxidans]
MYKSLGVVVADVSLKALLVAGVLTVQGVTLSGGPGSFVPSAWAQENTVDVSDPSVVVDLSVLTDGGRVPGAGVSPTPMDNALPHRMPGAKMPVSQLLVQPKKPVRIVAPRHLAPRPVALATPPTEESPPTRVASDTVTIAPPKPGEKPAPITLSETPKMPVPETPTPPATVQRPAQPTSGAPDAPASAIPPVPVIAKAPEPAPMPPSVATTKGAPAADRMTALNSTETAVHSPSIASPSIATPSVQTPTAPTSPHISAQKKTGAATENTVKALPTPPTPMAPTAPIAPQAMKRLPAPGAPSSAPAAPAAPMGESSPSTEPSTTHLPQGGLNVPPPPSQPSPSVVLDIPPPPKKPATGAPSTQSAQATPATGALDGSLQARLTPKTAPEQQTATPPSPDAVVKGNTMQVLFPPEQTKIPDDALNALGTLAQRMKGNDALRLQLLAYAGGADLNASKARRLSLSRALSVRSHLIQSGVRSTRIDVRALGDKSSKGDPNRVDITIVER